MSRGRLRIYLGAAPGVGKTFAMLNEGRRRAERGTDVVIGFVETHGRARTAEQLQGLEIVRRHVLEHRGAALEELDIDSLLDRHPEVALVDELAHTNAPGSRNEKRWQDVEALLAAGIDVISTVNIQHLASLNDVVGRITGVEQRETVPDQVVRSAEQIELVDMTPEALRRRMEHGNIYRAEAVDAALANYFRVGNLTALRELALLWIADQVDDAMKSYRQRHGIDRPWETRERVAVTITGAPHGDDLIRRAARVAARSKAELIGIHVRVADGLAEADGSSLEAHKRLLVDLGGRFREVIDGEIAKALVATAVAENATQLIIGASHRSYWNRLTSGSIINKVVALADGSLDIHVIASETSSSSPPRVHRRRARRLPRSGLPRSRQVVGFICAVVGLPLLTLALAPERDRLGFASISLCFLMAVVVVGALGGVRIALLGAVVGFLLLDYEFADPIHTLTIANERDSIALFAFLAVAVIVSALGERAARRSTEARRARAEAQGLASMAGALLREDDPLPDLVANLVTTFGIEGASLLTGDGEGDDTGVLAAAGAAPPLSTGAAELCIPLTDGVSLAMGGPSLAGDAQAVVHAFAAQLSVAIESRRLRDEAATAAALAKANELRSTLLAAVSHDLRTPLAAIKTSTTSLLDHTVPLHPRATDQLLETIDEEADRLNDLVGNLLDLGRIEADALSVTTQATSIADVIEASISLTRPTAPVKLEVPDDLPKVDVDPGILERAISNLLDNADRFTPPGSAIGIVASAADGIEVRVIDHGPGIPPPARDRLFQPFERLEDSPESVGVGLGLAVAHGFIDALNGRLWIDDTPGGGTTMVIALPARTETP